MAILKSFEKYFDDPRRGEAARLMYDAYVDIVDAAGTVLGPFIFLAIINSAYQDAQARRWKFVDDMNLAESRKIDVTSTLQTDLDHLTTWTTSRKTKLHPKKCKVMHVTFVRDPVPRPQLSIAGNPLMEVKTVKLLGLHVQADLALMSGEETDEDHENTRLVRRPAWLTMIIDQLQADAANLSRTTFWRHMCTSCLRRISGGVVKRGSLGGVIGDQATCKNIRGARRFRQDDVDGLEKLTWAKECPDTYNQRKADRDITPRRKDFSHLYTQFGKEKPTGWTEPLKSRGDELAFLAYQNQQVEDEMTEVVSVDILSKAPVASKLKPAMKIFNVRREMYHSRTFVGNHVKRMRLVRCIPVVAGWKRDRLISLYRNKNVYLDISNKLRKHGFEKTTEQCRSNIKNLKTAYEKAEDNNQRSGRDRVTQLAA
ncbi:hypothetical protein Bbelb_290530 [Branchiostoma belcheri]|nr:hypothetical protein Bbelb_290530 [Branchiostoma belcheri]